MEKPGKFVHDRMYINVTVRPANGDPAQRESVRFLDRYAGKPGISPAAPAPAEKNSAKNASKQLKRPQNPIAIQTKIHIKGEKSPFKKTLWARRIAARAKSLTPSNNTASNQSAWRALRAMARLKPRGGFMGKATN